MESFARQIPTAAYINAEMAQAIGTLSREVNGSHNAVLARYDLAEWNLINAGHVASLLYCLFVVSRHIFLNDAVEQAYWNRQMPLEHFIRYFDEISGDQPKTSSDLLRRFRNSIAHVRYERADLQNFLFTDGPTEADVTFRQRLPMKN